jgi:DNA-binding NarL/FixJ family response regulator
MITPPLELPESFSPGQENMPITVSIVEDNAGVREGLVRLLQQTNEFRCLACYASGEVALREIPALVPNVVLMDINLPGIDGVECVRKLHLLNPDIRIVMLTVYEQPDHIFNALSAGAIGYLLKQKPSADLLNAIRDAHQGGAPMSSQIARKVVHFFQSGPAPSEANQLSSREVEVLDLLAKGHLIKEIADRLNIGFGTVRTYIRRIYEKLHVHSRAQAVAKYLPPPARSQKDRT